MSGRILATVTQGGADAFAQASMATALTGLTKTSYLIQEVHFEFILPAVSYFPLQVAAAQDLQICICRRSKTSMPNMTDFDIIKKFKWGGSNPTAAGWSPIFQSAFSWKPEADVLIVEDPIYLQIDSTATAATWSCVVAIDYDVKSISEIDRLALLTQSLQ